MKMSLVYLLISWIALGGWSGPSLGVTGHGYMLSPPGRASMWREGWPTPADYSDNQQFCGGFHHQWAVNGGKCGVCGDPYDGVRVHETGGEFATGTVVRHFRQGQVVNITVIVTANHYGFFEFSLCKITNANQEVTQECLNNNLLRVDMEGHTKHHVTTSRTGAYFVSVVLPRHLTCDRCLLQWRYHAGNSWGVNSNGHGCLGCGPQEEFYACADVRISKHGGHVAIPTTQAPPTSTDAIDPNAQLAFCPGGLYKSTYLYRHQKQRITKWCNLMCNIHRADRNCPKSHCMCG